MPARWLTLAVVSAATAMLLLDVTVVNARFHRRRARDRRGIDHTFRQLGIAVGIAMLGAVFAHHADGGLTGLVDGFDAVFAVAATIAAVGAIIAWPLPGGFVTATHQTASGR